MSKFIALLFGDRSSRGLILGMLHDFKIRWERLRKEMRNE